MASEGLSARLATPFAEGTLAQRVRLASGLVLFAFALTHFINHGLGLISLDTMEAMQSWRRAIWRSAPGTVVLYGAFSVHIGFALARLLVRRTWRMPVWEAVQLILGLSVPYLLLVHALATRGLHEQFGLDDRYLHELWILWPGEAASQTLLLAVVWIHACLGLHYWLRIQRWYRRAFLVLFALAVLVPVLATAGWIVAAREVALFFEFEGLSEEQFDTLVAQADVGTLIIAAVGAAVALGIFLPRIVELARPRVTVSYPGGNAFKVAPGPTLLEISRMLGIPHASVCGGRARCSTCRVAVLDGLDRLEPPTDAERHVLERIDADDRTRLACQLVPHHDITIQPLVPAREAAAAPGRVRDAYHWGVERPVVVMFTDIRNFTGLAEERLPFDVVFILNRYLGLMAGAVEDNGGYVDKFIGDGIMAIFGISDGVRAGARNALAAAAAMGRALGALNREIGASLDAPIRMGIGIHAGPAILGRIGAVQGAGESGLRGITALGDTVNAASRLETATKELGPVVVSEAVLVDAGVAVEAGARHEIMVKGRDKPLAVRAFAEFAAVEAAIGATKPA